MFNREILDELKTTQKLIQTLITEVKTSTSSTETRLNTIYLHLDELVPKDVTSDFPHQAVKRPLWGPLSNSHTDINPRRDVGMSIAIPTKVWAAHQVEWRTVHLLGYICPSAKGPGYDEADVVVIDRKGFPRRYDVPEFASAFPHFYRVSRV